MEFPGTIITKPVRRGILVFFILMFFLITPLIILYTIGYRYDFTHKSVSSTGAINIDIEPQNAAVYMDNVEQTDKMPLRLKDKMPGKYLIRITADGYFDWQKIVDVKSKQTIYIKDISMIKKNNPENVVSANVEKFSLSPNYKYLAYLVKADKEQEIWIKNLENNEEKFALKINTDKNLDFTWAENNNYLTVHDLIAPYNTLYLINADDITEYTDLIDKIRYPVTKFYWSDSSAPEFYYSTELKIISMIPNTDQRLILTDNIYEDWFMEGDKLWVIAKSTTTEKISLIEDVLGFKKVFASENEFSANETELKILTVRDGQVLLKKKNVSEMILLTQDKKFNISGDNFLISKFSDWWLISTPWEIWTYTKGGEPMLLNRTGQQLKKIVPLDKYNTLALNWAEKTTALFPYYLVTHDLVNQPVADIFANTDSRMLYFLTEYDGQRGIWKMGY